MIVETSVFRTGFIRALITGICFCEGICMAAPTANAEAPARHQTVVRSDAKGEARIAVTLRGHGPVVVLIPSLGRGAADFDDLADRLATAGYEPAAIDPRGIGDSAGPMAGLTLADYAADVAAVAHELSLKPVVLIGHAFGNRVARATAAAHPEAVSALVLLAAGGQVAPAPDASKALMEVFDTSLSPAEHRAAVQKAFFAPGADPDAWLGGWYPPVMRAQRAAAVATGAESWVGAGEVDIFIVQAEDDVIAPPANAEALAKAYPGRVKVAVLPHAGHAMLPEQPQAIADLVIGFLDHRKGRQ
jgi:pimeloyl-ACP methyl ester carboxylesterase